MPAPNGFSIGRQMRDTVADEVRKLERDQPTTVRRRRA
jgi:hypothetical protein